MAANAINLRAALSRIGWTNVAATAFTDIEGFASISDVGLVTRDFLATVCKKMRTGRAAAPAAGGIAVVAAVAAVDIPALNEFKLYGMHLWVSEKLRQGIVIVPGEFTAEVAAEYTSKVRTVIETSSKKDEDIVKQPDAFTKDTEWVSFYKLLINYLGSKTGNNQAPLSYVARKLDDPLPAGTDFDSEHERLVAMTPHTGDAYASDNGTVWTVLKQLTLKGPAYTYISQYEKTRNGREALKSLVAHYKGSSQMSKTKQGAYDEINNATYSGEKRNYTFENYVNRHTKAHQTLEEYNEPVPESKKVDDFLRGIHDITPQMVAGKANVYSNAELRANFTDCANYLTNFVQSVPKTAPRSISAMGAPAGRTGGRGGRGRDGRGRGRGSVRGGRGGNKSGGPLPTEDKNYTDEEWKALSYDQRDAAKRIRHQNRNKRGISAVQAEAPIEPAPANAGDQFAATNKKGKN